MWCWWLVSANKGAIDQSQRHCSNTHTNRQDIMVAVFKTELSVTMQTRRKQFEVSTHTLSEQQINRQTPSYYWLVLFTLLQWFTIAIVVENTTTTIITRRWSATTSATNRHLFTPYRAIKVCSVTTKRTDSTTADSWSVLGQWWLTICLELNSSYFTARRVHWTPAGCKL